MNAYENNNLVKIKSRHFPQRFCKISNTKLLFSAEIQQQQNKKRNNILPRPNSIFRYFTKALS